jgi:hypothetical protein
VEHSVDGDGDGGWHVRWERIVRCWERVKGPQSTCCRGSGACESNEAARRDGDGSFSEDGGTSVVTELAYGEERVGVLGGEMCTKRSEVGRPGILSKPVCELDMVAPSGRVTVVLSVAIETASRLLETLKNGLWIWC